MSHVREMVDTKQNHFNAKGASVEISGEAFFDNEVQKHNKKQKVQGKTIKRTLYLRIIA
jgi:hypothetical protein